MDAVTPEQTDLARRLAACPSFCWLPGMLTVTGARVIGVPADRLLHLCDPRLGAEPGALPSLPDLTDDATGGCLLSLLPLGSRGDEDCAYRVARHWRVRLGGLYAGATLGEACAKALISLSETTP